MERTQYRRKQKKPAMPPIGHLLLLLALIAVVLVVCITLARKDEVPAEDPQTPESGGAETQAPLPKGDWKPTEMPEGSLAQGDLVLVNAAHGFEPSASLVTVYSQKTDSYFVKDTELSVDSRIMLPLNEWMDAFREATGIDNVNIVAGYRTKDYQQKLYDNAVTTKGKAHAESYIALPGHSEHHTGLAVDLDTYYADTGASGDFDGRGKYAWVEEHAWQFGFTRRYPENKVHFTGIAYEPWHFRYVGIPHAYAMKQNDQCLEEYLEFLREHPFTADHFFLQCDGKDFEIYYCPQNAVVVPEDRPYTISGDNIGGYIVTVTGLSA